jgi:hypothetical protein
VLGFDFLLDRLPDPGELRQALSEVFAVDPARIYLGRRYADPGGPPVAVYATYLETGGGDFRWLMELSTDATVAGPAEAELAAAICRRFGVRALLPVDEPSDEWWRLITAESDRRVRIELDALDDDRYVLAE